jgi:MFS family permease
MTLSDSATRRTRWSATAVVLTAPPFNTLVSMAIVPALPGLAAHIGTDANGELLSQMVMVTPAFMIALFGPLSGIVAERLGVRNCLVGALLLYALSGLAGMLAPDLFTLTVSRLVLGAAGGAAAALGLSVAAQLPETWRDLVLGLSGACGGGLAVLSLGVGGVLADWGGWQAPMLMYALVLPIILPTLWGVPARFHEVTSAPDLATTADWAGILRLWPFYLLMVLECMALFVPDIQGPFLLVEEGIGSATGIGVVTASYAVCSLSMSIAYGFVRKWLGERAMLVITPTLLGIGQVVLGLTHGTEVTRIAYLFAGLMGAGWVTATLFSAVLARAPAHGRAIAMGLIYSAIYVGQFVNPALLTPIRHLAGIHATFFADGILMMTIGFIIWSWTRPSAGLAANPAE